MMVAEIAAGLKDSGTTRKYKLEIGSVAKVGG
jgi:hypothetical protein